MPMPRIASIASAPGVARRRREPVAAAARRSPACDLASRPRAVPGSGAHRSCDLAAVLRGDRRLDSAARRGPPADAGALPRRAHAAQCFYQKHLTDALPEAVRGVMIKEKDEPDEYVVIDDLAGLVVARCRWACWRCTPGRRGPTRSRRPIGWSSISIPAKASRGRQWSRRRAKLRDRLGELGLESFLRTSGGKGLHVVAPLARRNTWDQLKEFAKAVADDMVRQSPDRYIATMSKAKRRGKIFVDYLRNQRGATAIASYSTRARAGAPVAAPLAWDELIDQAQAEWYTVANMPRRLAKLSKDPWEGFFDVRQSITQAMFKSLDAARPISTRMIARQNSGRSSGLRLETKWRSIDHRGVFPHGAGVDQVVLDARRAGDPHAAIDAGRDRNPAAVADGGHQLAGGGELAHQLQHLGVAAELVGHEAAGHDQAVEIGALASRRSPRPTRTDSRSCRRSFVPPSARRRRRRHRPRSAAAWDTTAPGLRRCRRRTSGSFVQRAADRMYRSSIWLSLARYRRRLGEWAEVAILR